MQGLAVGPFELAEGFWRLGEVIRLKGLGVGVCLAVLSQVCFWCRAPLCSPYTLD